MSKKSVLQAIIPTHAQKFANNEDIIEINSMV